MLDLPADTMRDLLRSCLNIDRWVDGVTVAGPFDSLHQLLAAARAGSPFSAAEIDEALGDHPRIGEKHAGRSASAAFSRNEQAGLGADDSSIAEAIARANADYEARFGRVFLIRAKGRSRAEILAELRRRLLLDEQTELSTVGSELLDITLLRLETVYQEHAS